MTSKPTAFLDRPHCGLNADFSSRAWHVKGEFYLLENEEAWGEEDAFVLVRQQVDEEEGYSTLTDIRKLSLVEAEKLFACWQTEAAKGGDL